VQVQDACILWCRLCFLVIDDQRLAEVVGTGYRRLLDGSSELVATFVKELYLLLVKVRRASPEDAHTAAQQHQVMYPHAFLAPRDP
jgi:hypothetical protein